MPGKCWVGSNGSSSLSLVDAAKYNIFNAPTPLLFNLCSSYVDNRGNIDLVLATSLKLKIITVMSLVFGLINYMFPTYEPP